MLKPTVSLGPLRFPQCSVSGIAPLALWCNSRPRRHQGPASVTRLLCCHDFVLRLVFDTHRGVAAWQPAPVCESFSMKLEILDRTERMMNSDDDLGLLISLHLSLTQSRVQTQRSFQYFNQFPWFGALHCVLFVV